MVEKQSWFKPKSSHWKVKLREKEQELDSCAPEKRCQDQPTLSIPRGHQPAPQSRVSGTSCTPPAPGSSRSSRNPANTEPCSSATATTYKRIYNPSSRIEGVMFVPHTPDGGLARSIQKAEDVFASLHRIACVKIV